MRNRMKLALGLACTLVLTVVIAAAAAPRGHGFRSAKADVFLRAQPFSVAGQFTGTIGGEMVIDDLPYHLAPNASVYEIGSGALPMGTDVQNRYVTLFGLRMNGSVTIYSVFVRPAGEVTFQTTDLSASVHVRDASAPR